MLYKALRIGKVGVIAPIAATEGAIAALLSVLVLGERVTAIEALALIATVPAW